MRSAEQSRQAGAEVVHPDASGRTHFCCPREPQVAKQPRLLSVEKQISDRRILIVIRRSHTALPCSDFCCMGFSLCNGVLSLVIPTLHIKLSNVLRFIECKSAFHKSIHCCMVIIVVSLSFHVKESNK